jgi:hypothetical protein
MELGSPWRARKTGPLIGTNFPPTNSKIRFDLAGNLKASLKKTKHREPAANIMSDCELCKEISVPFHVVGELEYKRGPSWTQIRPHA